MACIHITHNISVKGANLQRCTCVLHSAPCMCQCIFVYYISIKRALHIQCIKQTVDCACVYRGVRVCVCVCARIAVLFSAIDAESAEAAAKASLKHNTRCINMYVRIRIRTRIWRTIICVEVKIHEFYLYTRVTTTANAFFYVRKQPLGPRLSYVARAIVCTWGKMHVRVAVSPFASLIGNNQQQC